MNTTNITGYLKALILVFLILGLLCSFQSLSQNILKDEAIELKQQTFYIARVSDERSKKGPIADLAAQISGHKAGMIHADLPAAPELAISRYLERNLPADKARWPVIIQIKELKITETAAPAGRIDGQISLSLDFGLEKAYGFEHLVDYPGRLHYVRSLENTAAVERNLRSMLKGGLVYLNDWIKANAQTSKKLAKSVRFSFSDYTEKVEGDTIYYSALRPLTWADFQSTLRPAGPYQAAVMPSIGYTEEAKVEGGVVVVKLLVKAYVPKSACWASPTGRDDYALNHEQRHFDIVKIIAEQFKRKMMAKKLSPETYEAAINST
jgi:hypothetical protein